jgi:hypothetical protein
VNLYTISVRWILLCSESDGVKNFVFPEILKSWNHSNQKSGESGKFRGTGIDGCRSGMNDDWVQRTI